MLLQEHKTVMSERFQEPDSLVDTYYKALYTGDLKQVKHIMTQKSYIMILESFGLKLSMKDPSFKAALAQAGEDAFSLKQVEKALSNDLKSRDLSPAIKILGVELNGQERQTVYYTVDNKNKRLYFSKENDGWKINYFAGRPVSPMRESYISKIKKKIISLLPSFK